ncbi:hypothetical protein ACJVDH_12100 [Pedobacter sp. AW1-32]|uniref:hypothetical protein n=1 Tax=Pedobacter sp. AW1-32 TaxID=3383026 RepID=UPI003FED534F
MASLCTDLNKKIAAGSFCFFFLRKRKRPIGGEPILTTSLKNVQSLKENIIDFCHGNTEVTEEKQMADEYSVFT